MPEETQGPPSDPAVAARMERGMLLHQIAKLLNILGFVVFIGVGLFKNSLGDAMVWTMPTAAGLLLLTVLFRAAVVVAFFMRGSAGKLMFWLLVFAGGIAGACYLEGAGRIAGIVAALVGGWLALGQIEKHEPGARGGFD